MRQFFQLILVQFREFFRQPGIVFWTLGFPVLMAWGLGIAFTKNNTLVKHIAWVSDGNSHTMNGFFNTFHAKTAPRETTLLLGDEKTGQTTFIFKNTSLSEAELMVKRGKSPLIIREEKDSLSFLFDVKNPEAQLAYLQLTNAMKGEPVPADNNIQPLVQKGMRYVDFLVPGLMAMNIMMSCMWGISYTLIDKRTKKLMRRMIATPMNKSLFLFAHLVSRVLLSFFEAGILLFFTWMYFDISIQGSIPALLLLILAGNIAFFGIAVLVSSKTSNTQLGNGLINLVVMPMMVCSGVFFTYHNFPDSIIAIIRFLPLTTLADSVRGVFIEGMSFADIFPQALTLCGIGLFFYLAGYKLYKWY